MRMADDDESVVILSPSAPSPSVSDSGLSSSLSVSMIPSTASSTSTAATPGCSGGGCYKIEPGEEKRKRWRPRSRRSFTTSTPKSSSVRPSGNNNTITLDSDDESPPPSSKPRKSPTPEIIVLDEDSLGSTKVTQKSHPTVDDAGSDIEIVGILVAKANPFGVSTPPQNSRKKRALSRQSAGSNVSGRVSILNSPKKKRKSRSNTSFQNAKLAVERAKSQRRSNSNVSNASFNLRKTAVNSHAIFKKKSKNWNIWNMSRNFDSNHQNVRNFGVKSNNQQRGRRQFNHPPKRKVNQMQRRQTSPVFLLGDELGPGAGSEITQRLRSMSDAPTYMPLMRPTNCRQMQNPNHVNIVKLNLVKPSSSASKKPSKPAEPNFISVEDDSSSKQQPGSLRPIVIDGSNVAMGRRNDGTFSCRGIQICAQFFTRRGHDVTVFVPQYRRKPSESSETELLEEMEKQGIMKFTASREAGSQRIASYDDRYIVQYAHEVKGIIVSNDQFKDLYKEEAEWRETIRLRILQCTWVKPDVLWFPQDPLGKGGPSLDDFLRF